MTIHTRLQIKPLTDCEANIPELAELWYEGISKQWVPHSSVERAKASLKDHLNIETLPLTYVALLDNKAIGMASLRTNDGIRDDLAPWLGSLVVHPDYQNHKIGEQLIDTIKSVATQLGYQTLYLLAFDKTIPNWYRKLGWHEIGEDELFGHPVAVMQIALSKQK